jgi:chemotaxis protein methyltransferase CheR
MGKSEMGHRVSDNLLSQLNQCVTAQMGLYFPRERWGDLERGVMAATGEFGFEDVDSCIQWLLSALLTRQQTEILASHLTVGETYFFRDPAIFEALKTRILPELIRAPRGAERRLRIWCAGCGSGEEPYSMAIVLTEMLADLADWQLTILATDINSRSLRKAAQGVYTEWSFRGVPPWIKEQYFTTERAGHYTILPAIKTMVAFAYHNLVADNYPSLLNNTNAMDIVLCRNVLMYFTPEWARSVVQNLHRSLVDGGWLIVSPSEGSVVSPPAFVPVQFPEGILYKKRRQPPQGIKAVMPVLAPDVTAPQATVYRQPPREDTTVPPSGASVPQEVETSLPPHAEEGTTAATETPAYIEALALYREGRYAAAARTLVKSSPHLLTDVPAMTLLARTYANQGKLLEALMWCERALATDHLYPTCQYLHATILQAQGRNEEAVKSLRQVLYLDPNSVLAHYMLGRLTARRGNRRQSRQHFQEALSLLSALEWGEIVPESEGISVGRLMEVIRSTEGKEALL